MNKINIFFIFLLFSITTISCDKFKEGQEIPAYLRIDTILLVDNPDIDEGSLVHNIEDVWLRVDDQLIGAYNLPTSIPVLENGEHKVVFEAGIKFNGMSGTRGPYPFYEPLEISNFNLVADSTINYLPEIHYQSSTIIPFYESFDDGLSALKPTNGSDTSIMVDNNIGIIYLDSINNHVECVTNVNEDMGYYLPTDNSPVFLELEYNCNQIFGVGMYMTNSYEVVKEPVIFINSTEGKWEKIYINLTPNLNTQNNLVYVNIYILAEKIDEVEIAEIKLDNFKLIYKDL